MRRLRVRMRDAVVAASARRPASPRHAHRGIDVAGIDLEAALQPLVEGAEHRAPRRRRLAAPAIASWLPRATSCTPSCCSMRARWRSCCAEERGSSALSSNCERRLGAVGSAPSPRIVKRGHARGLAGAVRARSGEAVRHGAVDLHRHDAPISCRSAVDMDRLQLRRLRRSSWPGWRPARSNSTGSIAADQACVEARPAARAAAPAAPRAAPPSPSSGSARASPPPACPGAALYLNE